MLGALFTLGFFGVAAAKAAYDNYDMKRYTSHYDDNGNHYYCDRNMTDFVNGEHTLSDGYTDEYGRYHRLTVGEKSKKVYNDYISPCEQAKYDEQKIAIERAKKYGKFAACIYHPQFKRNVAVELSTGKVIACLMKYKKNGVWHYRKFYVKPGAKEWEYNKTAKGDYGIEITEEEFQKLRTTPETYRGLPSDNDVVDDIW